MARQPRIEYAGGVYHVLSRGDRREAIFVDDSDRRVFLHTLGQACARTGWQAHAYVLMPNHYHLLLETPEPNLVAGMQWLQGTYTQRFNHRYRQCGHLFQGRYKALPIELGVGPYFATVGAYIHLNPARAGLVGPRRGRLAEYAWSSYPGYLQAGRRPPWLCVTRVLGGCDLDDTRRGRREYERFMEEQAVRVATSADRVNVNPDWSKIRRGWCFGGDSFRESLLTRLDRIRAGPARESLSGQAIAAHDERQAQRLYEAGMKRLGLTPPRLQALPKGAAEKRVLAWYVRGRTTVSNAWLAGRLQCGHPANVPGYVRSVEKTTDRRIASLKTLILKSED